MVGVLVGLKLEACWDFFSRRIEWRPKQIVLIHFLEYYRKCNFIGKKTNKQTNKQTNKKPTRACLKVICQVFLAVLLCKILESRWVFKSVHRYNVLIFHSFSSGKSVRALTILIDVWHVNHGSRLSFPVCSNKIKSGRLNEILWAFVE